MWSVFHLRDVIGDGDRAAEANEVEKLFEELERLRRDASAGCTTSRACAPTPS